MRGRISLRIYRTRWCLLAATSAVFAGACGDIFNPAFINTNFGGQVPVTPGPVAAFVLVNVINQTNQNAAFFVTVEKLQFQRDDDGDIIFDEDGQPLTQTTRQSVRLSTAPVGTASQAGILFDCSTEPVVTVGLGENLLPTDTAVSVGGTGPASAGGVNIPVGGLNPLQLFEAGNFNCGDTVSFRAITNTAVAGGVSLQAFVLPGSEQPGTFEGPSTFENYADFLAAQGSDED